MRILLAGHHELAARVLIAIAESGREVAYVAEGAAAVGRGEALKSIGERYGLASIADDGALPLAKSIREYCPTVLISCGYRRIISHSVLKNVPFPVNIHFGALPQYRGCWSIPWAILKGETHIGVTLHRIEPGIDDGPIFCQRKIEDDGTLSCRDLYDKAVGEGVELVSSWLAEIGLGTVPPTYAQDECEATYFGREYPGGFKIDWRATLLQVSRYIRASYFPPYAPASSCIGSDIVVYFHWPLRILPAMHDVPTGTVVVLDEGNYAIAVLNGFIVPRYVNIMSGETALFSDIAAREGWGGLRFS